MYIIPGENSKMPRLWRATEKLLATGPGFKATILEKKCTDLKGLDAPRQISKGWRVARGVIRATGVVPLIALIIRNIYRSIFKVKEATKTFDRTFDSNVQGAEAFLLKKFPNMPSGTYLIRNPNDAVAMGAVLEEAKKLQLQGKTVYLVLVKNNKKISCTAPWVDPTLKLNPTILGMSTVRGLGDETTIEFKVKTGALEPLPLLTKGRGLNLNAATHVGGNYDAAEVKEGGLDFVIASGSYCMVGDGTGHNRPERRMKIQEGWNAAKTKLDSDYSGIIETANDKEELQNKLQELFKSSAQEFRSASKYDSTTWSFASVIEFQGEKLLVVCQAGDSPIFLIDGNKKEYMRFMPERSEDFRSDAIPKPVFIPVTSGMVVLGLTDGYESPDRESLFNDRTQNYEQEGLPKKIERLLVEEKMAPAKILEKLSADIPSLEEQGVSEAVKKNAVRDFVDDHAGFVFVVP